MKPIDKTILKETRYLAVWVGVLSVLMHAVFLVVRRWDYTVLLGNLLGGTAALGNFFLMGLSVQKALGKDEKGAKSAMKVSQAYRTLLMLVLVIAGVVLPWFHTVAVILPIFFPRIGIAFRPLLDKRGGDRAEK